MMQFKNVRTAAHKLSIAVSSPPLTPVMVVSHERSGTHFLMNSVARGYGYVANPWINLDLYPFAINYHHPPEIARLLMSFAELGTASIVKSHHPADFFAGVLDRIAERYVVLYIHRDPVEVMLSFFQFMHHWRWHEGPKLEDPLAFARAQPEGQMLRYQVRQQPSLLHRWQNHVEGWLAAAAAQPRIVPIRYKDLRDDYATTLQGLVAVLGSEPVDLTPPPREKDTIHVPDDVKRTALARAPETIRQLRRIAADTVGATMARAGYELA
jgi:Sulfotransferase domain